MAAQKGRSFVVQMGNGATSEAFTTIGGLRANSVTVNNTLVDITSKDDTGFRNLLPGAGITSLEISGDGVFVDAAIDSTLRGAVMANTHHNFRLVSAAGETIAGSFAIPTYSRGGAHDAEETFSFTLASDGTVTWS